MVPMRETGLVGRGLEVLQPGLRTPVLRQIDIRIERGEIVGLSGRSGSGKSTLLRVLNGLTPWIVPAEVRGVVELEGERIDDLDPGQRAHLIACCLDRPEAQLFLPTPRHELEASRRLYGRREQFDDIVATLGIEKLLDRRTVDLSSGERQRVALAAALAAGSRPILLDEPTAHLDDDGAEALAVALDETMKTGGSVLVAEHGGWRIGPSVSRWVDLRGGRLHSVSPPARPLLPSPEHAPGEETVLTVRGLSVEIRGRRLFSPIDLRVRRGEVIVLTGANGVGKSSLARAVTGHGRPACGFWETPTGRPPSLMLPEADLQLFGLTVEGELRSCGASPGEIARVLRRHRLEVLAARKPWSLSRGERQRLVHAAHDVLRPDVIIIDEPAQGLDAEDLADFVGLIHRRAARGRAYLLISHRLELARAAHRHLRLGPDGLEEVDG